MSNNKALNRINQFFNYLNSTWVGGIIFLIIGALCIFATLSPIISHSIRTWIIEQKIITNISEKDFLSIYITLIGAGGIFATIWFNARRIKNQEKQLEKQQEQIDVQISNNIEIQYAQSISILNSDSETARIGAIHSLKKIADKYPEFNQPVMEILCSHVREQAKDYTKKHPKSEVQSCINMLFKDNGIYYRYYKFLPSPKLNNSCLNGADFNDTICIDIDFTNSFLRDAEFNSSILIGAKFNNSKLENCNFSNSNLLYSHFNDCRCFLTRFDYSNLCLAKLMNTPFIGAHFNNSSLISSEIINCSLDGAYLYKMEFLDCFIQETTIYGATTDKRFPGDFLEGCIDKEDSINYNIFHTMLYQDKVLKDIDEIYRNNGKFFYFNEKYNLNIGLNPPDSVYSTYHYLGKPVNPPPSLPDGLIGGKLESNPALTSIILKQWDKIKPPIQ